MDEQSINNSMKEKVKKQLRGRGSQKLPIDRVPNGTAETFKDWAFQYFSGDYGMLLAYLVRREMERDYIETNFRNVETRISGIEAQVRQLIDQNEANQEEDVDEYDNSFA